jgi:hypothetical protein
MRDDSKLTEAFRALDDIEREDGVSPTVEARLRAQVRLLAAARRQQRVRNALAMAAAVIVTASGVLIASWRVNAPQGSAPAPSPSPSADAAEAIDATEFMPLPYSSVPTMDGQIVRLEVPRAALASFGLMPPEAIDVDASRGTVLADVIVGEDGLARAVRFIRPAREKPQERAKPQEREQPQEKQR